ncbi:hypothetical protein GCM10011391_17530 [Pullulanibacillus camelliae]|uniref:Ribosome biogenesis GTPase RsgA n=1 Tax=Pullulanibacillus camelliae TaxID=1707096 RepID=A0A8J2VYP3_9BACL|nr:hypothetical protein [Pullulanibacillus camelliae]GGE39250.1 hypothetical protein GCM10011391_17530 [Pullulanibacillus camelliae]
MKADILDQLSVIADQEFTEIAVLAAQCKFRDCQHQTEPDCAVQKALADGTLDEGRYANYIKLRKEIAYMERKTNQKVRLEEKRRFKKITSNQRKKHG